MAGARVLWVTNYSAPYRRPVWAEIGRHCDLSVLLLGENRSLQAEGRRGREWQNDAEGSEPTYRIWNAATLRVASGEREYFFLGDGRGPRISSYSAVLFGGWESPAYWQVRMMTRSHQRKVGFYESTAASARHTSGPIATARAWFMRSLDAVVVPGVAAGEAVSQMGVPRQAIRQGFNAVDVAGFAAAASGAEAPVRHHRFVYVGQLIERKNVAALISAFAMLPSAESTLTIVGNGPERERLETLARESGVGNRVTFRGEMPYADLPNLLAKHETLILPSTEEVWGLVVNEALAAGCHVVVSNRAGVAPSVREMRGVYVVEPDAPGLAGGLHLSESNFEARVSQPEILAHTPQAFAEVFLEALGVR